MKHRIMILISLFFLITIAGCKKASKEGGKLIFELPAVPEDSKLVWQATEMTPSDINLYDYRSQLHLDGENMILTCCPLPVSSDLPAAVQNGARDGRQYLVQGNTFQSITADWLKESPEYGVAADCFFREDGTILILYRKENNVHTIREYNPEDNTFQDSNKIPPKGIALAKLTELSNGTLLLFDAENYIAYAYAPHTAEYSNRFKAGFRNGCVDMGEGKAAVRPDAVSGYVLIDCLTGQQLEELTPKELFEAASLHYSKLIREGNSCLPNPFIQNAMLRFRMRHPEVDINYEIMLEKDFPQKQEIEEAIRRLNTELISGKEMDILITNNLPFDAYGEKGILTDLSNIVADITADGSYHKNAVTGYGQNGVLYAAICGFGPIVMAVKTGTPADVVTLTGLQKFLDSHPESTFFVPEIYAKPDRLSEIMYEIYFSQVKESGGRVSKERLSLYMHIWKTIYDRMQDYSSTEDAMYAYTPKELSYLILPDSPAAAALLTEVHCNSWITPIRREDLELLIPGPFEAGTAAGICSQSKEPELAEEFLRFLFSEEAQETADGFNLLSVSKEENRKRLKANAAFFAERGQSETYESEGTEGIFEMYTVREKDADTLFSLYDEVHIPFKRIFGERQRKDDLYKILHENGMAFVMEQSGYEEAFQNVYKGIFLYEQERE